MSQIWFLVIVVVLLFAITLVLIASLMQWLGYGEDNEWKDFSNCLWFSFSTFIGESVMRLCDRVLTIL